MIEFARVREEQFGEICALYQDVISDMNQNGLRQWEWEVYPTRAQLEEDMHAGRLYSMQEDGCLSGAFALSGDLTEEYSRMEWHYGVRPATLHRFAMLPQVLAPRWPCACWPLCGRRRCAWATTACAWM